MKCDVAFAVLLDPLFGAGQNLFIGFGLSEWSEKKRKSKADEFAAQVHAGLLGRNEARCM